MPGRRLPAVAESRARLRPVPGAPRQSCKTAFPARVRPIPHAQQAVARLLRPAFAEASADKPPSDPTREFQEEESMGLTSEQRKKRYAEDPEYREWVLAMNRGFRRRHRKELNERKRLARSLDPEFPAQHHERIIMTKYGLAPGEYARMLAAQNGVCKICQRTCHRRLSVDHCHITKKVRWLLCSKCNVGLGQYDHDPDLLREAANCLDEWLGLHVIRDRDPVPAPLTLTTATATRPLAWSRCIFAMGPPSA
jgi:hypothetical protein